MSGGAVPHSSSSAHTPVLTVGGPSKPSNIEGDQDGAAGPRCGVCGGRRGRAPAQAGSAAPRPLPFAREDRLPKPHLISTNRRWHQSGDIPSSGHLWEQLSLHMKVIPPRRPTTIPPKFAACKACATVGCFCAAPSHTPKPSPRPCSLPRPTALETGAPWCSARWVGDAGRSARSAPPPHWWLPPSSRRRGGRAARVHARLPAAPAAAWCRHCPCQPP